MLSHLPQETAINGKTKHMFDQSNTYLKVNKVEYIKQQVDNFKITSFESLESKFCEKNETTYCGFNFSELATVSSDSSCTFNGQVLSLSLGLDHNGKVLFNTSQLSLERGTVYGLVGKNGTGKSSLAKILASKTLPEFPEYLTTEYLSPYSGARSDLSGKLSVRDYMLYSTKRHVDEIDKQIEMLEAKFEQVVDQNVNDTEFDVLSSRIGELCDLKDELDNSSKQKVDQMLDQLGFKSANMMETAVEHLSSGWRYKCQLATTFLTQPDVLVIDEPSYLDASSVEWFIEEIKHIASF